MEHMQEKARENERPGGGENETARDRRQTEAEQTEPRDHGDWDLLLSRMKEGDKDAFRRLYMETARSVYGYALSVIRNPQDAEEIMQDVYVAAWTQCAGYEPAGKPLAWLFTITRNLCYGCLRRQTAAPLSLDSLMEEETAWEPADPRDSLEAASEQQALLRAMDVLTEEERRLVLLHAVGSMKHREIAENLRLPLATVLSKYSRALKKLRKELTGETKNFSNKS